MVERRVVRALLGDAVARIATGGAARRRRRRTETRPPAAPGGGSMPAAAHRRGGAGGAAASATGLPAAALASAGDASILRSRESRSTYRSRWRFCDCSSSYVTTSICPRSFAMSPCSNWICVAEVGEPCRSSPAARAAPAGPRAGAASATIRWFVASMRRRASSSSNSAALRGLCAEQHRDQSAQRRAASTLTRRR